MAVVFYWEGEQREMTCDYDVNEPGVLWSRPSSVWISYTLPCL